MAIVLEKQAYRLNPPTTAISAFNTATALGGIFVPGLGLAGLATMPASKSIQTDLLEQSGRVSLSLLHDAGYDLQQAPLAWWLVAAKPSKGLAQTNIPPRALNLYRALGLIWKNSPEAAAPPNAPVTSSAS